MKIFIDSADIEEIKYAYSGGVIDGITTNPSLMKATVELLKKKGKKIDMEQYIREVLTVAKGTPVSLEVAATTHQGMVAEGKAIFSRFNSVAGNVVIKIPVNPSSKEGDGIEYDGIKAVKDLSKAGIPVNCTLIFTPEQALLAAKAGAKYVSPFAGRIDDLLREKAGIKAGKSDYYPAEGVESGDSVVDDDGITSGVELVAQIVEVFAQQGIKTEVLAASIRNSRQARECALAGAHVATLPFGVIKALLAHQKTAEGMRKFTADVVPEYAKLLR